jgi:hypothetical protein
MIDFRAHPNTMSDDTFLSMMQWKKYSKENEPFFSSYGTDSEDPYYNLWLSDPHGVWYDAQINEDQETHVIYEKTNWQKEGF